MNFSITIPQRAIIPLLTLLILAVSHIIRENELSVWESIELSTLSSFTFLIAISMLRRAPAASVCVDAAKPPENQFDKSIQIINQEDEPDAVPETEPKEQELLPITQSPVVRLSVLDPIIGNWKLEDKAKAEEKATAAAEAKRLRKQRRNKAWKEKKALENQSISEIQPNSENQIVVYENMSSDELFNTVLPKSQNPIKGTEDPLCSAEPSILEKYLVSLEGSNDTAFIKKTQASIEAFMKTLQEEKLKGSEIAKAEEAKTEETKALVVQRGLLEKPKIEWRSPKESMRRMKHLEPADLKKFSFGFIKKEYQIGQFKKAVPTTLKPQNSTKGNKTPKATSQTHAEIPQLTVEPIEKSGSKDIEQEQAKEIEASQKPHKPSVEVVAPALVKTSEAAVSPPIPSSIEASNKPYDENTGVVAPALVKIPEVAVPPPIPGGLEVSQAEVLVSTDATQIVEPGITKAIVQSIEMILTPAPVVEEPKEAHGPQDNPPKVLDSESIPVLNDLEVSGIESLTLADELLAALDELENAPLAEGTFQSTTEQDQGSCELNSGDCDDLVRELEALIWPSAELDLESEGPPQGQAIPQVSWDISPMEPGVSEGNPVANDGQSGGDDLWEFLQNFDDNSVGVVPQGDLGLTAGTTEISELTTQMGDTDRPFSPNFDPNCGWDENIENEFGNVFQFGMPQQNYIPQLDTSQFTPWPGVFQQNNYDQEAQYNLVVFPHTAFMPQQPTEHLTPVSITPNTIVFQPTIDHQETITPKLSIEESALFLLKLTQEALAPEGPTPTATPGETFIPQLMVEKRLPLVEAVQQTFIPQVEIRQFTPILPDQNFISEQPTSVTLSHQAIIPHLTIDQYAPVAVTQEILSPQLTTKHSTPEFPIEQSLPAVPPQNTLQLTLPESLHAQEAPIPEAIISQPILSATTNAITMEPNIPQTAIGPVVNNTLPPKFIPQVVEKISNKRCLRLDDDDEDIQANMEVKVFTQRPIIRLRKKGLEATMADKVPVVETPKKSKSPLRIKMIMTLPTQSDEEIALEKRIKTKAAKPEEPQAEPNYDSAKVNMQKQLNKTTTRLQAAAVERSITAARQRGMEIDDNGFFQLGIGKNKPRRRY